jgi:hypothetical protein
MKVKMTGVMMLILLFSGCTTMEKTYQKERAEILAESEFSNEILTEEKLQELPEPLQRHFQLCGFVGKPIAFNAQVHWQESAIKLSPEKDWGPLLTQQFNSVKPVARIAYMKFHKMPVAGRDIYRNGQGEMKGKLLNLFRIIYGTGPEISQSALLTIFAEKLLVPGYAFQENIHWETISDSAVKAVLNDHGITVTGIFYFDEKGYFQRFYTEDRYYDLGKGRFEKVPFSAYVDSYQEQDGLQIPKSMRAVWHRPEGDYEYYRGTIEKLEFNVQR